MTDIDNQPPIDTTFAAWLRALKQGAPWEDALLALRRCAQVMQSRKAWVRANIVLAKTAPEKEQAAWCAQQAGETLWGVMNRPHLALALFRFAAENSSDPSDLFALTAQVEGHIEALDALSPQERATLRQAQVIQGPWGETGKAISFAHARDVEGVNAERDNPQWLQEVNRLWNDFQSLSDEEASTKIEVLHQMADRIACFGETDPEPLERVHRTAVLWRSQSDLRSEVLRALRGGEHYESMIPVLEIEEALSEGEAKREVLMELGDITRVGIDDPHKAAAYFESIIDVDKDDREAWGEYLECMEEIGDQKLLLDAISKRCALAQGLERRQLMRRRMELLMETGELKPPSPPTTHG